MNLFIDTGASLTVLGLEAFERLKQGGADLGEPRYIKINTANGVTTMPVYTTPSFAIDRYLIKDFEFGVADLGGSNNESGLLGMNFLSHFRFEIDQTRSELILSKR